MLDKRLIFSVRLQKMPDINKMIRYTQEVSCRQSTLTCISAVIAAFRADSKPPSAIKLLTNRSIIKRRPGLTLISFPEAERKQYVLVFVDATCSNILHSFMFIELAVTSIREE